MPHNQTVLGNLLKGKNLDSFLKRNRVAFSGVSSQNAKRGIISKFELSPLKPHTRPQSMLIFDRDIISILETSYKTLTYCNLVSCMFITGLTFDALSNARHLQWLCLSNNQHLLDRCAISIVNNCTGLLHLNISKCRKLTELTMGAIAGSLACLESLDMSYNSQMIANFRNPAMLKNMGKLRSLDVSYCAFSDYKLLSVIKHLTNLETLSLEGCSLLTMEGLTTILLNSGTSLRKVIISKTAIERYNQDDLKQFEMNKGLGIELVYNRE